MTYNLISRNIFKNSLIIPFSPIVKSHLQQHSQCTTQLEFGWNGQSYTVTPFLFYINFYFYFLWMRAL